MSLDQQLAQTIDTLYNNASGFKQRMDAAGLTPADVQGVADLVKLPIMNKDELIERQKQQPPFGGMLAVPMSALSAVYQSPGPINEPSMGKTDAGNWGIALKAAGFTAGEVVLNAFGYHMTPAGASLHDSLNSVGCVVIPGGIGNQEQQIQVMASFGATGYVGLPSYLKALLDKAEGLGIELSLNKAFVLAEPLPPSLRQELKERGVDVYQAYGTAECGNLGYDTPALNGWNIPENVIIQICDINSGEPLPHGETGEVVVTLLNDHYAIVRFGVGDLSAIIPESVEDDGSLRLAGWQGRAGGATKVRGMFLHPTQLRNMMMRFSEVAAYQAVITRENHRDQLELHVVPVADAATASLAERLEKTAREAIKFRLAAKVLRETAVLEGDPIRDERVWE
ncbi:MAG: AMP-binding protein [Chloroflexota bacterium]